MSEENKTHVLNTDCILTERGRCEAGTMLSEGDLLPSTWENLVARGFLTSVADVEKAAETQPEPSQTEQPAEKKPEAKKK